MELLSFLTASKDPAKEAALRRNLAEVFGAHPVEHPVRCENDIERGHLPEPHRPWELIVADGAARGSEGLAWLYNEAAGRARGDVFVFLHDDVELLCHAQLFDAPARLARKPFTGVIGVAGTRYLPESGCWWKAPLAECRGAVCHPSPAADYPLHANVWPAQAGRFGPVLTVDGVLMMLSRRSFERLKGFDAEAYAGLFHMYDTDLSFRSHLAGLKNQVCYLPLLHASVGVPDNHYERAAAIFRAKFAARLPARL